MLFQFQALEITLIFFVFENSSRISQIYATQGSVFLLEYWLTLTRLAQQSSNFQRRHSAKALWYQMSKDRELIGLATATFDSQMASSNFRRLTNSLILSASNSCPRIGNKVSSVRYQRRSLKCVLFPLMRQGWVSRQSSVRYGIYLYKKKASGSVQSTRVRQRNGLNMQQLIIQTVYLDKCLQCITNYMKRYIPSILFVYKDQLTLCPIKQIFLNNKQSQLNTQLQFIYYRWSIQLMQKKEATKTVEFANLPEDHKAQFIQFLIKNNICFQEGKENCTARVSLKPKPQSSNQLQKSAENIIAKQKRRGPIKQGKHKLTTKKQILIEASNKENMIESNQKQIKTPTKQRAKTKEMDSSSLSLRAKSNTPKKAPKLQPKSIKQRINHNVNNTPLKQSQETVINSTNKIIEEKMKKENSKEHFNTSIQHSNTGKIKKGQISRQRVVNKYASLFQISEKGRAVRWSMNMLERSIEQIYDDIFMRNTQCLQNRNIGNAMKALTQTPFPYLVDSYFKKKFKGSKLAATNLNNMLYSLSHYVGKEACSIFILTFQNFVLSELQNQDLLYYLFSRNVLKKELRVYQKVRDINRTIEGCYFTQNLRARDISKYLRGIIGRDSELVNEYKQLINPHLQNDQIAAYDFLRLLLQDYHLKRISNRFGTSCQSFGNTLFEKECSYERKNTEELTFGEDHEQQQTLGNRGTQFWSCLSYSHVKDSLFELIMEKMGQKVAELVEILANDIEHEHEELQTLEMILYKKSQCLVKAVFEMNKMKWFKELAITCPAEQDMTTVEAIQIRLRQLRENPTGRQIGEFCKCILTTKALIDELEIAMMVNE